MNFDPETGNKISMIFHSIKRAYLRATIAIASAFDVGVERIIRDFVELDQGLERFIDKQDSQVEALLNEIDASLDRERAVIDTEAGVRRQVYDRVDDVMGEQNRARRIREAVQKIVNA